MRRFKGRMLHFALKKAVLTGFIIFSFIIFAQSQEPKSNEIDVQKQLANFELKFQNALLENTNYEAQLIHRHDSVCSVIQSKLAISNEKMAKQRLSKKEQKSLEERLEMELRTIDMIKQMSFISRGEIKRQYENELKGFFEKYDLYLSIQ
jgi:hypothetical protein